MKGRFYLILVVLFSVMPLEAFAQTVITLAPEAVAGLTYSPITPAPLTPSTFFETQSISALAGVVGSIIGLTGDSNFAFNLGIGYESRGAAGSGYYVQSGSSSNIIRENYVDLTASFRSNWFQAGLVVGFPLNWHLTMNSYPSGLTEWNFDNSDMTTTEGIFAAGNFTVSEWTSGKLIFIARLDIDDFGPSIITNNGISLTTKDTPIGYNPPPYFPRLAGIFIARIGLSYEFTIWSGVR